MGMGYSSIARARHVDCDQKTDRNGLGRGNISDQQQHMENGYAGHRSRIFGALATAAFYRERRTVGREWPWHVHQRVRLWRVDWTVGMTAMRLILLKNFP